MSLGYDRCGTWCRHNRRNSHERRADLQPGCRDREAIRGNHGGRTQVLGAVGELIGVRSLDEVLDMVSNELMNLAGAIRNERRIEASTLS